MVTPKYTYRNIIDNYYYQNEKDFNGDPVYVIGTKECYCNKIITDVITTFNKRLDTTSK